MRTKTTDNVEDDGVAATFVLAKLQLKWLHAYLAPHEWGELLRVLNWTAKTAAEEARIKILAGK